MGPNIGTLFAQFWKFLTNPLRNYSSILHLFVLEMAFWKRYILVYIFHLLLNIW
jgi:hypothetical protein